MTLGPSRDRPSEGLAAWLMVLVTFDKEFIAERAQVRTFFGGDFVVTDIFQNLCGILQGVTGMPTFFDVFECQFCPEPLVPRSQLSSRNGEV